MLGGIYAGFFNPTPAASVGVALVWLYGVGRRTLGWREMVEALKETAGTTGMIYLILLGAETDEDLHVAHRPAAGDRRVDRRESAWRR